MPTKFSKYHALGNDYIVIEAQNLSRELSEEETVRICHRNFGIGSDGILLGYLEENPIKLRILNPDGSEAEKSGNGIRIFCRHLFEIAKVKLNEPFKLLTKGGMVSCEIINPQNKITVEMGQVTFRSDKVPVNLKSASLESGEPRDVLKEKIKILDKEFLFSAASIGNPHCVIVQDQISEEETRKYGPHLEVDKIFPNRTNVQFAKIIDRSNIQIEIWERGAGYTLASGSSSSAAAAVCKRLGLCDNNITVHMPGGLIEIKLSDDYQVQMTGSVTKVCDGILADETYLNK